jgi:uncharacterized protein (TIGR02118 family)
MVAAARGSGARALPVVSRGAVYAALPDDAPLAAVEGRKPRAPRAEAVLELWSEGQAPPEVGGAPAYRVEEVLHWDDPRPLGGGEAEASSDVVVFYFVRRRPDLSQAEFVRRYREGHAPLARVHHPGIRRYVQNFVVGSSAGAPEWDAIAQLHFASEDELRQRFYRDAESPARIAADVAGFVDTQRGLVLVTREGPRGEEAR